MQSREIVAIDFKQCTEHIKTYCGQMHSSWTLKNFPVPYREAQVSSKKHTNFLWVGNARGYITQTAQKRLAHRTVQSLRPKIGRNGALGRLRYTRKWEGRTFILYFEVFWRNGMVGRRLGSSRSGCRQRVGGGVLWARLYIFNCVK
jgi:hypothetical protein